MDIEERPIGANLAFNLQYLRVFRIFDLGKEGEKDLGLVFEMLS